MYRNAIDFGTTSKAPHSSQAVGSIRLVLRHQYNTNITEGEGQGGGP